MEAELPFAAGERFEIRRLLGSGSMGVVYEAYDHELDETVALKVLQRTYGHWLGRFKQEFRSLHDLSHPNIVALGEFFDGESAPFFTMELVRGVSFLDHVRCLDASATPDFLSAVAPTAHQEAAPSPTAQTLPSADPSSMSESASLPGPCLTEAIAYDEARLRAGLKQLALGIAALHQAGKVHRDIKPSNIIVAHDGRVVLLDFGLVFAADDAEQSIDDNLVGTVNYMAPEQALSGDVTPAADWYSLGVVLFEALTGALPHTGSTAYEIIVKKQKFMAAPPRQFLASVPPDLDALCTALLQTQSTDRPSARDIFDRLGIDQRHEIVLPSSASGPSLTEPPFVGRTDELAKLRAGYDRSREAPLIYLVEGVSGVGKSKLVDQFLTQLAHEEPDTVVLAGRCYEREVVSYKAFDGVAVALSRYLARLPPVQLAELIPFRAALLARLFPVLKRVEAIAAAAVVPDVADPHDQRLRMFAALRDLFLRLTDRRRLVWYIDDLQWTDADSLVLLQDLLTHEDKLPVFIIATMRPVDDTPRKQLLAKVEELAPTERLPLAELTPDEARELAALLLPGRDPVTLDTVASDAGGHPLFLQELARHTDTMSGAAKTGATFEEMLTARIDRLDKDVQTLLQVVSVFGGPLTQEVAALAAELSSAEQIRAATILRAAHLARTDGVRRGDRIVTYHDRVREHVSAHLDAARRKYLHERLALALEQTGAAEHDPRALVRHARAAGRHALAATHARAAARHAVASLAFDQAAEFFATAIELGSHEGAPLRSLQIDLATALMHAGRGPEAAATFLEAADGAEPAVRLDCQRQAADQWIITGHLEQGMAALRSSLAEIGEPLAATPRRALARVVWNRARLRLRGVRHVTRRESQVPVETLRRLDVLRSAAYGLAMVDNIRGADFNGRFLLLALRTGEPRRLVGALATEVIFLASQAGRAGQHARRLFTELVRLADDCPDAAFARTWVALADGASSFFEGRFTHALQLLYEAEKASTDGQEGMIYERNQTRVFQIHTLRLLGALQHQATLIADSVRIGRQRGDRYLETTLRLLQGQSMLAREDLSGARSAVDEATWSPPAEGFHLQHWYEFRARSELALYEGNAPVAVEALAPRYAELHRSLILRVKLVRADALAVHGQLVLAAAAAGHAADRGRAEVQRITRRLTRERAGYATVYGLLLRAGLAALDRARGDDDTVTYLREAIDHAAKHDMALHLAAARDRLGRLLGGDEGADLRASAASYAAEAKVVDSDRLFETVAPGLAAR